MAQKSPDKVPPNFILDELLDMTELLSRDVLTAARGIATTQFKPTKQHTLREWTPARGSKDIQFWRRTYVRALFAFVEAQIWFYKTYALMAVEGGLAHLTVGELALLNELQFDLEKGKVREQKKFLPVAENFRFAVYILAKAYRSTYVLDVSGKEWSWFREAIDIRNRITHPKVPTDIIISDEESNKLLHVGRWLTSGISRQLTGASELLADMELVLKGSKKNVLKMLKQFREKWMREPPSERRK
jgi:hypothetical protein